MSEQKVTIGVEANTTGAAQQVKQVDQATAGLAKSMDQLAKTSKAATDQVARLEAVQRRLRNVQGILSKEFGRSVPLNAGAPPAPAGGMPIAVPP